MGIRQSHVEMIKSFPGGWDAMAAALGYSRNALENRLYERKGQDLSTHDSMQMQLMTGTTHFAEAIAEESGGYFTRLPDFNFESNTDLLEKFVNLSAMFGDLAREHMNAIDDGEIDDKERVRLINLKNDIHTALELLLAHAFHIYYKDGAK